MTINAFGPRFIAALNANHLLTDVTPGYFQYIQTIPSTTWIIVHNLQKFPALEVIDSGGTTIEGDIHYIDKNTVQLTFSAAFSGTATCN